MSKKTPEVHWNEKKQRHIVFVRMPDGSRKKIERVEREDAENALNELLAIRSSGEDDGGPKAKLATFQDVCDAWIKAGCPNAGGKSSTGQRSRHQSDKDNNTVDQAETLLRLHVLPEVGKLWVDRTTTQRVEKVFAGMNKPGARKTTRKDGTQDMKPLATSTIYRAWKHLDSALQWGVRVRKCKKNPAADAMLPKKRPAHVRKSMSVEQAEAFFKVIPADRLAPLWLVAIMVGMRPGEITGLRWCFVDIDGEEPHIAIEESAKYRKGRYVGQGPPKADSKRTVGLHPLGVAALLKHRNDLVELGLYNPNGFVFPTANGTPMLLGNVRRSFKRLCGAEWTTVELRHSFISLADDALDENTRAVGDVVGHKEERTTLGYRHKVRPVIRHAVDAWNVMLEQAS